MSNFTIELDVDHYSCRLKDLLAGLEEALNCANWELPALINVGVILGKTRVLIAILARREGSVLMGDEFSADNYAAQIIKIDELEKKLFSASKKLFLVDFDPFKKKTLTEKKQEVGKKAAKEKIDKKKKAAKVAEKQEKQRAEDLKASIRVDFSPPRECRGRLIG